MFPPTCHFACLLMLFGAEEPNSTPVLAEVALPDQNSDVVPDPIVTAYDEIRGTMLAVLRATQSDEWTNTTWPEDSLTGIIEPKPLRAAVNWDLDANGTITLSEVERCLRGGFGLETRSDSPLTLRRPPWQVFNRSYFDVIDRDHDDRISKPEFVAAYHLGPVGNAKLFAEMDSNGDKFVDLKEVLAGVWLFTNEADEYGRLDLDLDGHVDAEEFDTQTHPWHQSLAKFVFPAFDRNRDGFLSLVEYRETPAANQLLNWFLPMQDQDDDGKISFAEFFEPRVGTPPLQLALLRRFVFDRFDRNSDGQLDETEFDVDGKRLAQVGQPGWGPDPVRTECERVVQLFRGWLQTFDLDGDGQLGKTEWPQAEIERVFPVKKLYSFDVWDGDRDGRVSPVEFQQLLREAWGIKSRRCPSDWLRCGSGHIVEFYAFASMDVDSNGEISRREFIESSYGTPTERQKWFPEIDRDRSGTITLREMIANGRFILLPWTMFHEMDRQGVGKLSKRDITENAKAWQKELAALSFPTFDDDGDGFLSPAEFRWTPIANPLFGWSDKRTDIDRDGALSLDEFCKPPAGESPVWLVLLSHEHFRRWDRNRDGKLTRDEYDFIVETSNQDSTAAFRFADKNHDGGLTLDEVFLDAKSDSKNAAAVLEYNRRKMRSEESFLGADADGNGMLNQTEYPKYERYLQGADEEDSSARPAIAGVASSSEEAWTYWIIGLDVLLVFVGGVYWMRRGVRSRNVL